MRKPLSITNRGIVLCDDNSFWYFGVVKHCELTGLPIDGWQRLPDIPQDPEPIKPEGEYNEEGKWIMTDKGGIEGKAHIDEFNRRMASGIDQFDGYKVIHHDREGKVGR